ncbi:MAG: alpha/beta fold hydrolase, partial [Dactylosporangium sp.]|nr:alpha/beta fold hydrolase [Dactylosporangium sp.]
MGGKGRFAAGRTPRRPLAARLAAVLAAVALLAAGCTFDRHDRAEPGSASAGTVRWRNCADEARTVFRQAPRSVTYECATIAVPRNWAQPAGETFDIALLRARAAGQRGRIGSLVVNPGGPGASGIQLAVYLSAGLPAEITRRFDIVGFDPRGVGRSSPVKCLSDADLDRMFGSEPDPVTDAQFEEAVAIARQAGEACAAKYGETLPLFSTEQAARDLDAVRAAVGDEKLTYLGYSYGTLLGATYAQLFPGAVRALVLDGAVDPRQDAIAASEGQARGFERAFDAFATWCRTSAGLCPIGPDARATVAGVLDQA